MRGTHMAGWVRIGMAMMVALLAGQAEAAPRISLSLRGDRKAVLTTQLARELCTTYECVLRTKVFTGSRVNFTKARKLKVKGILVGNVLQKPHGGVVSLALLTKPGRPTQTWRFPLTKQGTLKPASLDRLSMDLQTRLGRVSPPRPVVAAPKPAPTPTAPAPVPEQAAEPPPPEPLPAPSASEPISSSEPEEKAKPVTTEEKQRQYLIAAETGFYGTKRSLSYEGVGSGTNALVAYQVGFTGSPRVHLELFPFARSTGGALAGLGLLGDYHFSIGLNTENSGNPSQPKQSTRFSRIQAGLAWRLYPIASSQFVLVPAVSFQRLRFTVDGGIAGLPSALLSGVKGSLGIEIPLGSRVAILLGGGYVHWMNSKDLVGASFFRKDGAYALEAEGGLAVSIVGSLSLRVLGEYSATQYSLKEPVSSTYSATRAKDEYLGFRAMLRLQY